MKKNYTILLGIFLLFAAPLAGGLIRGLPNGFFHYPPLVIKAANDLPFSWGIFLLFCAFLALALGFILCPDNFGFKPLKHSEMVALFKKEKENGVSFDAAPHAIKGKYSFPVWGWVGCVLLFMSWVFAWGRFAWLGVFKDFMFFPLWLGYILLVDAQCMRRSGTSMLSRNPQGFWLLFPLSAVLWWYFEYLNRFVHNWWYEGVAGYSPWRYVFYSSLCFSTVLPAVFETTSLLLTFSYYHRMFARGPVFKARSEIFSFACMCVGVLMLFLTALFPTLFFPFIWLGPLVICAGTLGLARIKTPFVCLIKGHFVFLVALAVAALICGILWELWNKYSMPKWHYSVPYMTRYKFFEMPIPGYAGYLPFGIICWCGWQMLYNLLPKRQRDISFELEEGVNRQIKEGVLCGCE